MTEKWYVVFGRMARQIFCIHSYTCSEGPDQPPMHFVCRKCDHSVTDWQAEANYYHNLAAKWYARYQEAIKGSERA